MEGNDATSSAEIRLSEMEQVNIKQNVQDNKFETSECAPLEDADNDNGLENENNEPLGNPSIEETCAFDRPNILTKSSEKIKSTDNDMEPSEELDKGFAKTMRTNNVSESEILDGFKETYNCESKLSPALNKTSKLETVNHDFQDDNYDENELLGESTSSVKIVTSEPTINSEETECMGAVVKDISNTDKSQFESGDFVEPTDYNMKDKMSVEPNTKILSANESAFQRLASLGIIAEEVPVVESKESTLMKLASRGAISITPASGVSMSSSTSSSVSITPTKHKPGPKSAMMRQKAKKIKIDPGKSMDIDKDFNSLISFLATGDNKGKSAADPGATQENSINEKNLDPQLSSKNDIKPEVGIDISDTCDDRNTMDGLASEMEVDINDDRSMHETDSESHDGSKSYTHSSEHIEESDERIPVTLTAVKNVIEEGSAEILLSVTKNVFYNKVQEFNRDMSIAALTVFSEMHQQDPRTRNRGQKRKATAISEMDMSDMDGNDDNTFEAGKKCDNGITILEALSATGLRSIRYAREIPGVKQVVANDLSEDAVETIKKNIEHNGVGDLVSTTMSDASLLMYQHQSSQEWYDAIDLDPYGCPSRFLDSAVQAVRDGGLLLVTCTDMAVLAGNSPETCYVKYGAVSLRTPACHEMALRIALQSIESHANRYGRYIVPLLSFSADFYIRLVLQVYTSPVTCKRTTSKLSMVYQCVGCHTHSLQPLGQISQQGGHNAQPKFTLAHGPPVNINCFHCNQKHHIGGPIWSAPMYDSKFLTNMLKVVENGRFSTSKRMQGMLEVIREELPDVPLYYTIAGLCTKLHCQAIPLIDIRSAILNAGYKVSSSHAAPTAIKTNAPSKIIWDIMRCWVHMNPVSQKRLVPGSVPSAIIMELPQLIANFDIHPRARPSSSMRKLVRYQQNPEKNWGPGMRARCNNADETNDEKRRVNQNKNKNKKHIDIIEVVTLDDEDEISEDAATTSTPAS